MIRLFKFSKIVISKSDFFLNKKRSLIVEIAPLFVVNRKYSRLNNGHSKNFLINETSSFSPKLLKHFSNYKKGKNNKKSQKYESSSDEEDSDEDSDEDSEEYKKDSDIKAFTTTSLRLDLILKKCLGISRKKIEDFFYEKKLRRNGALLLKKATEINVGDEIVLLKNVSDENTNELTVDKVSIIKIKIDSDKEVFKVKARVLKSVALENLGGSNKELKHSEMSES